MTHPDNTSLDDILAVPPSQPIVDDDDLDDDDWLAANAPHRRVQPLTAALLVGTVLAAAFIGGVVVQKHHDKSLVSGSATPSFGAAGGLPSGLFALGGGASAATTGGGASSSTSGSAKASASPVAIGVLTAEHRHVLTLKNLGGKKVTVRTTRATTITERASLSNAPLKLGSNLTITGTTASDATVTATNITVR
jgi:hypothetical protein